MNTTSISPTYDVTTAPADVTDDTMTPNVTSSLGAPYALPPRALHYYHVVYLSLAIAVGVPGNVMVVTAYSALRKKSSCDWYILYIAVLDLIICLFRVPTHLAMETGHWQQNGTDALCKFVFWLSQSVITASVFLFGFVAVHRYIRVCRHTISITPRFSRNCILIISTFSMLFALPSVWMHANSPSGKCVVSTMVGLAMMRIFYTVLFVAFIVMFVIVLICYTAIIVKVHQNRLRMKKRLQPMPPNRTQTQTQNRTAWVARVAADPAGNDNRDNTDLVGSSAEDHSGLSENRMKMFSCRRSNDPVTLSEDNFSAICAQLRDPIKNTRTTDAGKMTETSRETLARPVQLRVTARGPRDHVPTLSLNVPAAGENGGEGGVDNLSFVAHSGDRVRPIAVTDVDTVLSAEEAAGSPDRQRAGQARQAWTATGERGPGNMFGRDPAATASCRTTGQRGPWLPATIPATGPRAHASHDGVGSSASSAGRTVASGAGPGRPGVADGSRPAPSRKSAGTRSRASCHVRLTMLLLMVTAVFVVSWVPPYVAMVWYFYVGYTPPLSASHVALQMYAPTGYVLNHWANPVLYLVFSPGFRGLLARVGQLGLAKLCCCQTR